MKKIVLFLLFLLFLFSFGNKKVEQNKSNETVISPTPTLRQLTLTPTPNLEKLFGPCTKVPVLMYHHVVEKETAKKNNQQYLNVEPEMFTKQMQYLKDKGYQTIFPEEIINFFDNGVTLPAKSIVLTFDDAYEDNYTNAFPVLRQFGFKATIFTPTGLIQNPEYLNWQEIKEMSATGLIYFGNHTWSHHASTGPTEVLEKEIGIADTQLSENEQNAVKIFAYPFGSSSNTVKNILTKMNYKMAFTTTYGQILCKEKRFELPRIRVSNTPLSKLGL